MSKKMIDPNEAPEGYRATEPERRGYCGGCAFWSVNLQDMSCPESYDGKFLKCVDYNRKDGQDVIFKGIENND